MIKKQTLRKGVVIKCEGELLSKEEIIALSENWNETQEMFFRKMLKQGGKFTLKGSSFRIFAPEQLTNSKGDVEAPLKESEEE